MGEVKEAGNLNRILSAISQVYQREGVEEELHKHVTLLDRLLRADPLNERNWSLVRNEGTVTHLKEYMGVNQSNCSIQLCILRLCGNMSDNPHGIGLVVEGGLPTTVINTLLLDLYANNTQILAECLRTLGLIAKNSAEQARSLCQHKCKLANHITLLLSKFHSDKDLVECGVMSLTYLFRDNQQSDYIQLGGRLALLQQLLAEHLLVEEVQFNLMRLFTVLTTKTNVAMFIEERVQDYALRNITTFRGNLELVRVSTELLEHMTYCENQNSSTTDSEQRSENLETLINSGILEVLRPLLLEGIPRDLLSANQNAVSVPRDLLSANQNAVSVPRDLERVHPVTDDIVCCALYAIEYLEEYCDCSAEEAVRWSEYLFGLLDTHGEDSNYSNGEDSNYSNGEGQDKRMIQVSCTQLAKLHEIKRDVPVTEEQCRLLYNIIYLHDDVKIFVGACGAIAEILPKAPNLATTLLQKGIHVKVLQVMEQHTSDRDIPYVGCLFMINFQLQLSQQTRLKAIFDAAGILEQLCRLFSSMKQEILLVKEFCLGAITLLFRDNIVLHMCREQPTIYWDILNMARTYGVVAQLTHLTLMLVYLLCNDGDISRDLLYNDNGSENSHWLPFVTCVIHRNYKYKEFVTAGLMAAANLFRGLAKSHVTQAVSGVNNAVNLLERLINDHRDNDEIMKYVMKTLIAFCKLDVSTQLLIIETVIPQSLYIFSTREDKYLCYLVYSLWTKLGDCKETLSAMLSKAIKTGDAIGVQIFLEMNADVNIPYNDISPITAAVQSRNPRIVEHVLWQNVEQQQVKGALRVVLGDVPYPDKVLIVGYLLRECGYRSQDQTIDWCNLELSPQIEPEWLFIIMDLNHIHYIKQDNQGRKISMASKVPLVKQQLIHNIGHEPSLLSEEFEKWRSSEENEDIDDSEVFGGDEGDVQATVLESKPGFLDALHREMCEEFIAEDVSACYRAVDALKDLYSVKVAMTKCKRDRIGSAVYKRESTTNLTSINISNNAIESLERLGQCFPIMNKLGGVEELNVNHNRLKRIPGSFGMYMRQVRYLDLSHNVLSAFPLCVLNMALETLILSDNEISMEQQLEEDADRPHDLLSANQSTVYRSHDLPQIVCPTLKFLEMSCNSLKSIPAWFSRSYPNLQNLDLSWNSIELLPDGCFGFVDLETLDFSHNQLVAVPEDFFQHMEKLQTLRMTNNHLVSLGSVCSLTNLQSLYLNNNRLTSDETETIKLLPKLRRLNLAYNKVEGRTPNLSTFSSELLELDLSGNVEITQLVIGDSTHLLLEQLKLSNTCVTELGQDIGNLTNLTLLDISYTKINNLPIEMGNLTKLAQLKLQGLEDLDVPRSIVQGADPASTIQYLRQKLKRSRPHYRIKLFVVGLEKRGKTSLCTSVTKRTRDKTPRGIASIATNGVVKSSWFYKGQASDHMISVWDFAGQEEFYATHQCFLSPRGVYLVVFSLQLGIAEIERMKPWLYTIQARAPNAPVIIVGTHRDKAEEKDIDLQEIYSKLEEVRSSSAGQFFPKIEDIKFVNALLTNNSQMSDLRMKIINVAENAEAAPADLAVGGRARKVKIMGEKVPASFLELERFVTECQMLPTNTYYHFPILTHDELVTQLRERHFDIEKDDLRNATSFLHECGVMLHYNDFTVGLDNLYFVEPEWLSQVFGKIITIREANPWVKEGILKKDAMYFLLKSDIKHQGLIDKLVRIFEKFEIAVNLDDEQILIPSKLPNTRPPTLNDVLARHHENSEKLERVYKMAYKPHGLWSRLVSRLALFAPDHNNYKCREMWSRGVYIQFANNNADMYFLVEGAQNNMIRIETPATKSGSVILGRIVHHIDTLIEEWYKGLLGFDVTTGDPYVEYLIPCKQCQIESHPSPHMFKLQNLIELSETTDYVNCVNHRPTAAVRIADIAPDVMLEDFAHGYLLDDSQIQYSENSNSRLGDGALGSVCIGTYGTQKIAVKIYKGSTSLTYQDFDRHPYYQLRQECSILRLLNHPSIVKFIGVLLRPRRCLLLELAGYGSLDGVIKSARGPLPRALVHRILLQTAEGLDYLHRKNVIYRDLKPQNILILSKDLGVPMNAKITDFGISRLSTGEGLISTEGTAGYIDPNIDGKKMYDFKVDIFSFGILIREMLTGERVLNHLNFPMQINEAFQRGKAVLDEDMGWPGMKEVLNYCIDRNPEIRPSALDVTTWLSRADVLCLAGIHSPPDLAHLDLREHLVVQKGDEVELWTKSNHDTTASHGNPHGGNHGNQYTICIISITKSHVKKKAEIKLNHGILAMCCYADKVLVGGPRGMITVLSSEAYRIDKELEIPTTLALNQSSYSNNIQTLLSIQDFSPCYVFLGMGDGTLRVYSDEEVVEESFKKCKQTIVVDTSPITRLASYKANLLVASHQKIHVYEIESFGLLCQFDLHLAAHLNQAATDITKLHVHKKHLWIALHNSSRIYVCEMTVNKRSGVITEIKHEERKTVDLMEQFMTLKTKPAQTAIPGPTFHVFDENMFENIKVADMRITCLTGCSVGMLVGLGNGVFLELDPVNYKLRFISQHQKSPLRVIVPVERHDHSQILTFGNRVLNTRGLLIRGAVCCSWLFNVGDLATGQKEYLEARKAMVHTVT